MKKVSLWLFMLLILVSAQAWAARYAVSLRNYGDWRQMAHAADRPDFVPAISVVGMELTDDEAAALSHDKRVRYIVKNVERHIFAAPAPFPSGQFWYGQMVPWGIAAIHATDAQKIAKGQGVSVVVLDTGIDCTNPDLQGQCAGGWNFVAGNSDYHDDNGHGTHVSGTIAAADNDIGVIGVAPAAKLLGVKVLGSDGKGQGLDILNGMQWCIDYKIRYNIVAINMSFGSSDPWPPEQQMIQQMEAAGITAVAATGNEGNPTSDYPAGYSTIAVGAVDNNFTVASFSNGMADVVAPGVYIPSTYLSGQGPWGWIQLQDASVIQAEPLEFSPAGSAQAKLKNCGLGNPADFTTAQSIGEDYIALMQRGSLSFAQKTTNSLNAKAKAEIIYNNAPGIFSGTLGTASSIWSIVALGISDSDGAKLLNSLDQVVSANSSLGNYAHLSGTSMATPHVTGAVAVIFSAFPGMTPAEAKSAILSTATGIGNFGYASATGYGLLNLSSALAYIQNVRNGAPRRRAVGH